MSKLRLAMWRHMEMETAYNSGSHNRRAATPIDLKQFQKDLWVSEPELVPYLQR